ncbi:DNA-methyltransferase [Priestia megaterium]|uniref:DNA-methyltransferase n=1 Tax=Priestia megaterium TaxID=1404 RepID=UPI00345B3F96
MKLNTIYNMDCVEGMRSMNENSIDLTVTSPPYDGLRTYNGYSFDFESVAKELYRITKPGGVVVWVVGDATVKGSETLTSFKQALYFKEIGFNVHDTMIYEKAGSAPPHNNRYLQCFEYMFIFSKGKPLKANLLTDRKNNWGGQTTFGTSTVREKDGSLTKKKKRTIPEFGRRFNIWRYANGFGFSAKEKYAHKHPAIFPEKLAEDHIRSWSNEGDIVLDPFMGSGTTAKMAKLNNRKYIGFELSEEYIEIANQRLEAN